jgi:leucyl-tRNA synthetase
VTEFNPSSFESKWQQYWDKNQTFKVGEPGAKKFYCLDMFPYPSGSGLHIGHPLGYTATDIYSRFKRMNGFSVLHPMGYDAFGLPAEQHAVNTGEHPGIITEKNCDVFTQQMKKIGLSYDWSREIKTCTSDYYKWTQWIFLKLYNSYFCDKEQKARPIENLPIPPSVAAQGEVAIQKYQAEHRLAFYADAMVNWCPALGTVLSNEEVIDGKSERGGHDVFRKPMKQWMLRITKYSERLLSELEDINWPEAIKEQQRHWIGKKTGAEIEFQIAGSDESITAFTTRADTLFGVTFFVIAPEHPLVSLITKKEQAEKVKKYCEDAAKLSDFARTVDNRKKTGVFTGGYVINPISDEKVPVYVGDYVLSTYGTGAVMGVPAHDERDFEFARTFQIAIRPVLAPEQGTPDFITALLEGEVPYTESGKMLASKYQVAESLKLEGKKNTDAQELITAWLEKNDRGKKVVNYKLRDWLFSRQRYWGEPIPIIHWEDGTVSFVPEEELPLVLPQVEDYKPSDGGESPLAKATSWLNVVCPRTGKHGRRETNTMPQWAGSCWYYLRFIDPTNEHAPWDPKLEKAWMNVDLYVGGAEHAVLHLLYARFWHKVLYDLGYVSTREPFQRLYNQGMILAHAYKDPRGALVPVDEVVEQEDGTFLHTKTNVPLERIIAKMSKSLKNVINPDSVIAEYGADTLRMYLMFMGPLDMARVWDSKAIQGNYRFLKRVWNLFTSGGAAHSKLVADAAVKLEVRKAIHKAVKKVTDEIEQLKFNTAISTLMECLNTIHAEAFSKDLAARFLTILSPLAPHLAEELWSMQGYTTPVSTEAWPSFDASLLEESVVSVVVQVQGKKRALIEVAVDATDDALRTHATEALKGTEYQVTGTEKFIFVKAPGSGVPKLINIVR